MFLKIGTSRLLLPIETIYFHNERYIYRLSCYYEKYHGLTPNSRIEFKEPAPIIEFLRSQVSKEIYNGAYKIL